MKKCTIKYYLIILIHSLIKTTNTKKTLTYSNVFVKLPVLKISDKKCICTAKVKNK